MIGRLLRQPTRDLFILKSAIKRFLNSLKQMSYKKQQIADLENVIKLKDLAITERELQANMWKATSIDLERQYYKRSKLSKYQNMFYFGLGVLATGVSFYVTSKAIR